MRENGGRVREERRGVRERGARGAREGTRRTRGGEEGGRWRSRSDVERGERREIGRGANDASARTLHPIEAPPCLTASMASAGRVAGSDRGIVSGEGGGGEGAWEKGTNRADRPAPTGVPRRGRGAAGARGGRAHSTWWSRPCGLQVRTSWSYWLRNMTARVASPDEGSARSGRCRSAARR